MYNLGQKVLAEFVGTFAFVFLSAGAVCAEQLHPSNEPPGLFGLALAQGLALAVMMIAVSHISGGHLNPAVTMGFWVTKRLSTLYSLFYWAAQLAGAATAAYLLAAILPESVWRPIALGTPQLLAEFTRIHALGLEALLSFLLVLVFFATTAPTAASTVTPKDMNDGSGSPSALFRSLAGFAVGLTLSVELIVAGPFIGAAVNPLRAFGPALAAHQWLNQGVYWVGALFGGILAAWLHQRAFHGPRLEASPEE